MQLSVRKTARSCAEPVASAARCDDLFPLPTSSATGFGACILAVCSSARRLETATVARSAVAALRGSVARGQKYVSTKVYPGGTVIPTAAARASASGRAR